MNVTDENTFLALDVDGECRDMMRLYEPGEIAWMVADDLGVNPGEVPRDESGRRVMPARKWIDGLKAWLRLTWLNDPSVNYFAENRAQVVPETRSAQGE